MINFFKNMKMRLTITIISVIFNSINLYYLFRVNRFTFSPKDIIHHYFPIQNIQ